MYYTVSNSLFHQLCDAEGVDPETARAYVITKFLEQTEEKEHRYIWKTPSALYLPLQSNVFDPDPNDYVSTPTTRRMMGAIWASKMVRQISNIVTDTYISETFI